MGKVILHFTSSLDGIVEDADGSLDWAFGFPGEVLPEADRVMRGAGVVVAGRRGYDVGGEQRPYGGAWSGTVMVLSHRPAPAGADPGIRFLDAPVEEALRVALATAAAGEDGDDVLVFSADIARQALDAGLVDEVLLHVVPVALGRGVRLFDGLAAPVRFVTELVAQSGQITTVLLVPEREPPDRRDVGRSS